jgi:DNA-binding XRE family transcriptional regulator
MNVSNHVRFSGHTSIFGIKHYLCPTKFFKNIDMKVGDNLEKLRNKKGVTQQEVADFVDVNCKTYRDWEKGEADVKSEYIPKLAEFFNIEIGDLFSKKPGEIVITGNDFNLDNKNGSINVGILFLLTDKEDKEQVVDVLKKRFKGNDYKYEV